MIESPRHELDAAIDRVAENMVRVPGRDQLLQQVIAQLPDRTATPWFMTMRVQMAAAAAVLLVAFLFARPSPDPAGTDAARVAVVAPATTPVPDAPVPARVPDEASAVHAVALRLPTPDSRLPTPDSRLPAERREDHERSLAPVEAIDAIELSGIAPSAVELDTAAAFEPLVLPELALDPKGDR